MTRTLQRCILTGAALLATSALAQGTPQNSTLRELQREAALVTVEQQIRPEDREAYRKLQADAQAQREQLLALREKALRAYIDDVRSGTAPQVARANANALIAQEAAALAQQRAQLMNDARAFAQKYPNLHQRQTMQRSEGRFGQSMRERQRNRFDARPGARFEQRRDGAERRREERGRVIPVPRHHR